MFAYRLSFTGPYVHFASRGKEREGAREDFYHSSTLLAKSPQFPLCLELRVLCLFSSSPYFSHSFSSCEMPPRKRAPAGSAKRPSAAAAAVAKKKSEFLSFHLVCLRSAFWLSPFVLGGFGLCRVGRDHSIRRGTHHSRYSRSAGIYLLTLCDEKPMGENKKKKLKGNQDMLSGPVDAEENQKERKTVYVYVCVCM